MLIWNISLGHILQNVNMYVTLLYCWLCVLVSSFEVFPLARYCDYYFLFYFYISKKPKKARTSSLMFASGCH